VKDTIIRMHRSPLEPYTVVFAIDNPDERRLNMLAIVWVNPVPYLRADEDFWFLIRHFADRRRLEPAHQITVEHGNHV
jgi:hypothetical protein